MRPAALATAVILLAAFLAEAQPAPTVARIGFLILGSLAAPETEASREAFRRGLREHGYVEGQDVVLEYRGAEGNPARLAGLAAELTQLKVDLIVAVATPAVRAARQATSTIPIVGVNMGDPVRDGLVATLARPGGNVTGTTFLGPDLVPKRFELLREAFPGASRVAILWHAGAFGERTMREMRQEAEASARALRLQVRLVEVRAPEDFERAFGTLTRDRPEALFVFPSSMLFTERRRLVALAVKHRIPLLGNAREFAELGGLMSYGAGVTDGARRAASHVDKILKGAKAGEVPVEQPTRFELVINLRAARALGLTIPPSLRLRADHVIE